MDIIEQLVEECVRASQKRTIKKASKNYDEYDLYHKKTRETFKDHLYYVVRTEIAKWYNIGEKK